MSHFVHIILTFQFCFVFRMEEEHPTVTKGVNMATLYEWNCRHYFIVTVTNCNFNFAEVLRTVLAILVSFLQFT